MTHDQSYPGSAGVMGQKWLIRDDPPNYTTIIYAEGGDFVTQVYVGDSRDSIAEEIVRLHNATLSGAPAQSSDGGVEGHALSSTLAPQASAVADVVVHPAGVESGPSDPVEAARSGPVAQPALPPIVDRTELVALLEDLASVNLSREACARQAARMADDLIARGLTFTSTEGK